METKYIQIHNIEAGTISKCLISTDFQLSGEYIGDYIQVFTMAEENRLRNEIQKHLWKQEMKLKFYNGVDASKDEKEL